MQGSDVSPQAPTWPTRRRIVTACVAFFVAFLSVLNGFRFEWAPWFCFGLYFLLEPYFLRRTRETLWASLKRPQGLAAFALLVGGVFGMARNIYLLFEKYR
jgi:hypothetical protein